MGSLRVAINHDVCARALLVEGGNLRDTIAGPLSHLSAVVSTKGNVELNINVVACLAFSNQLATGCLDKWKGASVTVRSVVAASHEDDYIGAGCVQLRRRGLCRGESGQLDERVWWRKRP